MENFTISITGGGSREDISKALELISKAVLTWAIEDIDGCEWNDFTLSTTFSQEETK
jgi:hypothetical protein